MDEDAFFERLNARGVGGTCPSCGVNDWTLAPHEGVLGALEDDGTTSAGSDYPVALIGCNNCAFLRLYSIPLLEHIEGESEGEGEPDEGNGS
jgi:hypothetical protein